MKTPFQTLSKATLRDAPAGNTARKLPAVHRGSHSAPGPSDAAAGDTGTTISSSSTMKISVA